MRRFNLLTNLRIYVMKLQQLVVINSGSSSIKFAVYEFHHTLKKSLSGYIQNIGSSPELNIFDETNSLIKHEQLAKTASYSDFYQRLISAFESNQFNYRVAAVGHRVVHGGAKYQLPIIVDTDAIQYLKSLIPFAPLHQPYNIEAIESIKTAFPHLPQVACFDTAFHTSHPLVADCFGLPRDFLEHGIKRYGFHGLSYEYIMQKFGEMNPTDKNKRIVVAHLGNGASMCAIKQGKSLDSTMGFTALDGLIMGTRCGNLDPGVVLYLMQYKHMSPQEIENMLYKKSGLLGVSGISSNMKILLEDASEFAKEAIDLYIYRIQRELGALTAILSGLDVLIFTGGIGEHAWQIREEVCSHFKWLGMELDQENNKNNQPMLHQVKSKIKIYAIPTNEEMMIANHTYSLVSKENTHGS